jgi:hypothetical protein
VNESQEAGDEKKRAALGWSLGEGANHSSSKK